MEGCGSYSRHHRLDIGHQSTQPCTSTCTDSFTNWDIGYARFFFVRSSNPCWTLMCVFVFVLAPVLQAYSLYRKCTCPWLLPSFDLGTFSQLSGLGSDIQLTMQISSKVWFEPWQPVYIIYKNVPNIRGKSSANWELFNDSDVRFYFSLNVHT